jgi:murein DD-endopeptidase MepM/ murein hydrolase activator NlpD
MNQRHIMAPHAHPQTQLTAAEAATRLNGAANLYAALREIAPQTDADLVALCAACDAPTQARLSTVDQGLLGAVIRRGMGLAAIETAPALRAYLATVAPHALFLPPIAEGPSVALLTAGQHPHMPLFSDPAFGAWFAALGVPYGLGPYGEARSVYQSDQFADAASPERRTIHAGIDVFAPAMTPVYAPLSGRVRHITYNADPLDYGNTLILQHDAQGLTFFSLYGHLAGTLPGLLAEGEDVAPGQLIAHLGDWHENGGWAPHIHFQIMSDMLAQRGGNFFGVGHASLWDVWSDICIDPNLVLRLPAGRLTLHARQSPDLSRVKA